MSRTVAQLLRSATALHAATLWQPWAWAVEEAGKDVENRGWHPPSWAVGKALAIHAGLKYDQKGAQAMAQALGLTVPAQHSCVRGAVVAVARLARAVRNSPSRWAVPGNWHWCLEEVVPLRQPVPCKGAQGLWVLPPAVLSQVRAQVLQGEGTSQALVGLSPAEDPPTGLQKALTEAVAATRQSHRASTKGSARGSGPAAPTAAVYVHRSAGPRLCEWCGLSRPDDASPHAPRFMRTEDPLWPRCEHGAPFLADCQEQPTAPSCCRPAWAGCSGPLLAAEVLSRAQGEGMLCG